MSEALSKILIVDDDQVSLDIMGRLLKNNGYQASVVNSGEEALELINNQEFDLVILDINMPLMNGFDVLKEIRKNHNSVMLPVIMLTVRDAMEDIVYALENKANDYVSKPCFPEEVLARVKTHISLKKMFGNLVEIQKMEAVTRLAGGIAHQYNNLLTGISGYSSVLAKDLKGNDDALRRLQYIEDASLQASHLTKDLMNFAETNLQQLNKMDLNHSIKEARELLSHAAEKNIHIEEISNEALWFTYNNSSQVVQMLVHLGLNSIDAMPFGGKLLFEASNRHVKKDPKSEAITVKPGNYVCVSVKDSGKGIPHEALSNIFDPFFTTKGWSHSVGMGLSLVYGMMKKCGGDVKVFSEEGNGTTVDLYFPAVERSN